MTDPTAAFASAAEIARAVAAGRTTAVAVATAALARIAEVDPGLGAYTDVTAARALDEAAAVDAAVAEGRPVGPLAGVPFAVKNLFDVAGLPTRAGSRINRERAPATVDAVLVRRMSEAGAVLLGTLNMGEYAYDFTGENAHDGACRNPHDRGRMSGGSSSGCGAATAAGLAPVSLGSDTNGSLRVPASLCGVFSLKPTFGRLPRTGTFPFVDSLDHLGPMARTVRDLALAYDVLQGPCPGDHGCAQKPPQPVVPSLGAPRRLRVGVLAGWFDANAGAQARAAVAGVAEALGPHAERQHPVARRGRGGPRRRLSPHQCRERGLPPPPAPGARRRFRSRDPRPLPRRGAAPRRLGGAGTARPALVARPAPSPPFATSTFSWPRRPLARRPGRARNGWPSAAATTRCVRASACWRSPSPASAFRSSPFRSSAASRCRSASSSSRRRGTRPPACTRRTFSNAAEPRSSSRRTVMKKAALVVSLGVV